MNTNALRENALDLEQVRADERISNTQWARVHIAKRALFSAADEIDRLREDLTISENRASGYEDVVAGLRAVIENAPHEDRCRAIRFVVQPCNCWKADAR